MGLISAFNKSGPNLNLLNRKIDIDDTEYLSKYFVLVEFNPIFTSGKNSVAFNGSKHLRDKSEIQIECLDSNGNSLYLEYAKSDNGFFSDTAKFVVSIHIFNETYNGPGKLIFTGIAKSGETVRWVGNITIDKTLDNVSRVRFYNKPNIEVRPLLYPVVDTRLAKVDYPPPPNSTTATARAKIKSEVIRIEVRNGGSGFKSPPKINIEGGLKKGGEKAKAVAVLSGDSISHITVTDGGDGYIEVPTVYIGQQTGGTGAIAVAVLYSRVVELELLDGGYGYSSDPTILISSIGGRGYGATGIAISEDGIVTSLILTNTGQGYIEPPNVIISSPDETLPPELNIPVNLHGKFYTYAASPEKNTIQSSIDQKRINIDYRLVITESNIDEDEEEEEPENMFGPSKYFNSQIENLPITLYIKKIQKPNSLEVIDTNITASYIIKKVIDKNTIILNDAFFYQQGKNNYLTGILDGDFELNYRFVYYNTNPDSQRTIELSDGTTKDIKDSYAEITYRNLKTFSGLVTRHKLYRKSSYYPGDFQLISDEPLDTIELLEDSVTFNRFYNKIGKIYNQAHAEKYWFPNIEEIQISALEEPIDAIKIHSDTFNIFDGINHVIIKTDSIGIENDAVYYPYDPDEFNRLIGKSYNSNFITLKKNSQYGISTNLIVEKEENELDAKVTFFFTSSISSIQKEKDYNPLHGLKIFEISIPEKTSIKHFNEKLYNYFTTNDDYYGTLIIVPYKCNIILSDISLKVYKDKGFSPEILFIRIPFPVNTRSEAFDIKAELFDIHSNLIFSDLHTIQTFDENGESLYSKYVDVKDTLNVINLENITIEGQAYLPNLTECPESKKRFVGWQVLDVNEEDEPVENIGKLCYTNISEIRIDETDYIQISAFYNGLEHTVKSLASVYDLSQGLGRKIFIDKNNIKEEKNPWFI
jgi:hypothetical protein